MLEQRIEYEMDTYNITNKTMSIAQYQVIYNDDVEIARNQTDRRAFVPGDIDKVRAYIGIQDSPELQYLESVWTPEVIAAYQAQFPELYE